MSPKSVISKLKSQIPNFLVSVRRFIIIRFFRVDDLDYLSKYWRKKEHFSMYYEIDAPYFEEAKVSAHNHFIFRKLRRANNSLSATQSNNPFGSDLCIIMQGPIVSEGLLTELTIQRYLKLFPCVHVILSSWLGEVPETLRKIEDSSEYFHIIENEKPKFAGISNVNMQIKSTASGIGKASELGSLYVLKTRTDQEILDPQALVKIQSLFQSYGRGPFTNRIIIGDRNSFIFRFYGVSDMFMFGHISDMTKFWNCPYDDRPISHIEGRISGSLNDYGKLNIVETFLTSNYLISRGHIPRFTLEDSLNCYRDYFCVIDSQSIKLRWTKYTYALNQWSVSYYPSKFQELTHLDWLRLNQPEPFMELNMQEILDLRENF